MPVALDLEGLLRGGNWALATSLGRLDVMQCVEGVESYEDLRKRAEARDLPDVGRVWFAGRDDLIVMKRAAGRPQDLIDIEELSSSWRGR